MYKPRDPKELVMDLLARSTCAVQVAAVVSDGWGIYSWGVNHVGFDGLGQHAEAECLRRANKKRFKEGRSVLYVAAQRKRNGKTITAKPCESCQGLIQGYRNSHKALRVVYRDADGNWQTVLI